MSKATTTTPTVTKAWAKIVDDATDYIIEVLTAPGVYIAFKSGAPTAETKGILLKQGQGMSTAVHGNGEIWARVSSNSDGQIARII